MGNTLDILFCCTTHCLFTSRYVQCVYICAVSAFLYLHFMYVLCCMPMSTVYVHTCVSLCKFVYMHVLFAGFLMSRQLSVLNPWRIIVFVFFVGLSHGQYRRVILVEQVFCISPCSISLLMKKTISMKQGHGKSS